MHNWSVPWGHAQVLLPTVWITDGDRYSQGIENSAGLGPLRPVTEIWQGSLERDKGIKGHQRKGFCLSRDLFYRVFKAELTLHSPQMVSTGPCRKATDGHQDIYESLTLPPSSLNYTQAIKLPVFSHCAWAAKTHQRTSTLPMSKTEPCTFYHNILITNETWIHLPHRGWAGGVNSIWRISWLTVK